MRTSHWIFALLAVALVAPSVADAQQPDTARRGVAGRMGGIGMMGGLGAVAANAGDVVLEHRTQLSLTAQQITQIEQIRARAAAQNQPLLARLRTAGYPTTAEETRNLTLGQLEALRARNAEFRPVLQELRTNQATASREIQNLLTLEQYTRLRELTRTQVARSGLAGRDLRGVPGRGRVAPNRGGRAGPR